MSLSAMAGPFVGACRGGHAPPGGMLLDFDQTLAWRGVFSCAPPDTRRMGFEGVLAWRESLVVVASWSAVAGGGALPGGGLMGVVALMAQAGVWG
ncbi:hypothetical protein GCM10025777_38610 [Membranihabitans marinus]